MTSDDLTPYHTTKIQWIDEYIAEFGLDNFNKTHKSIIDVCWGKMQNGDNFKVYDRCKDKTQLKWFVKFLCLFVIEGNTGYEFRNNCTEFHCINKRPYPLNLLGLIGYFEND